MDSTADAKFMHATLTQGGADNGGAPEETAATAELRQLRARVRELEAEVAEAACASVDDSRLNAFAAATNGWFWETDSDFRFTYFSPSVEAVTGVPPEWHYGKTREDLGVPTSVSEEEWRLHLEAQAQQLPFTDFVFAREAPDGVKWMRTSGRPYDDANGQFAGYRGVAFDITDQILAERRAALLANAIEQLDEMFVLWDADDRLVFCNAKFREINAPVAETTEPGTLFEDHQRAALAAGLYPEAMGQEDAWLAERLARHENHSNAFEIERQDGQWILVSDQRLPDGFVATVSTDITQRKQFEQAIASKNSVLEAVLQTVPDGVQVLDEDLNLIAWNAQLFEVLELDQDAIVGAENPGKAFRYALAERGEYGPGDIDALVASREKIARTNKPVRYERQLVTGKWMECRGNPIQDGGYLALYRDINARKHVEARLEHMATTDPLTGVANRRQFMELAETEFSRARRYERPFSVVMLDIDRFKAVNDKYGHAVGDAALVKVAEVCHGVIRESDSLCRFGGEEFVVLLPETSQADAHILAERVRTALANSTVALGDISLWITASFGIAEMSLAHRSVQDVLIAADAAMYVAKDCGRNRVVLADKMLA